MPSIGSRSLLRLGGLFLLLLALVYADPLFTRRNFAGRDPMIYHYPLEKAIHDSYARGHLPIWISEISGGRPLLANPNVGALYPVRPLLSVVSYPWAARIFPVLHWAASAWGMFLLLGVLGVSVPGAWVGAVTFVFSGVSLSYAFYPNIHPGMALLPWLAWALARRSESPGRATLALAIVWALMFLSGDVFVGSLGLLTSLLWILLEAPGERMRAAWRLAAALVLAALAAAPQIVASALWIPETTRAVSGLTLRRVLFFSISPFRLLEFVVPFPFGTVWDLDWTQSWGRSLYQGKQVGFFTSLYAGSFAVIAIVLTWRSRERAARFGRWLLAVCVAISVLPSLIPASWGNLHSPIPLRYPEKFAAGAVLALALLAALGFDAWTRRRGKMTALVAIGAVLTAAAVIARLVPGATGRVAVALIGGEPKWVETAGRLLPGALAEAGLLWAATVIALDAVARGTSRSVLAGLALLTLVPVAANRKILPTFREEHLFAPSAFDRYLARADPAGEFRTIDEQPYAKASELAESDVHSDVSAASYGKRSWQYFTHALWGRGTVFNLDVDSGDLSRVESLRYLSFRAAQYTTSQSFFGSLALKWGVRLRDQKPVAGYRRARGNLLVDWDEHEAAYPDVRVVEGWREEKSSLDALNAIRSLGPGQIVVESGQRRTGRARPGAVRVLEKTPERMVAEVETPDPTWLFVLRGYFSYRTILLDGRRVEDFPAQLAFSAVAIPSGRHRLEWNEEVPGGDASVWGPVVFAAAAAAILLRRRAAPGAKGAEGAESAESVESPAG